MSWIPGHSEEAMARAGVCGTSLSRHSCLDVGFAAAFQGCGMPPVAPNRAEGCPGLGEEKPFSFLPGPSHPQHICGSPFRPRGKVGKVRSSASRFAWLFQPTSSSHSTHSYSAGETQHSWARRHAFPLQPSLLDWLPATEKARFRCYYIFHVCARGGYALVLMGTGVEKLMTIASERGALWSSLFNRVTFLWSLFQGHFSLTFLLFFEY